MIAVISLLVTLSLSLLVTRVGAMALMLTGLSREAARFQARSAFTGVGFTTSEAESVATHPVRRQIIMLMMMLGNLSLGAVVATLMLSMLNTSQSERGWLYIVLLVVGLLVLVLLANNRSVERHLNRVIAMALKRWGNLTVRDHVAILHLDSGYAVSELVVEPQDWLAQKTLLQLHLPNEGILVLGIRRADGKYVGTPTAEMEIRAGDTLVIYGPIDRIEELDQRRGGSHGEAAHQEAVMAKDELIEGQRSTDTETETPQE